MGVFYCIFAIQQNVVSMVKVKMFIDGVDLKYHEKYNFPKILNDWFNDGNRIELFIRPNQGDAIALQDFFDDELFPEELEDCIMFCVSSIEIRKDYLDLLVYTHDLYLREKEYN